MSRKYYVFILNHPPCRAIALQGDLKFPDFVAAVGNEFQRNLEGVEFRRVDREPNPRNATELFTISAGIIDDTESLTQDGVVYIVGKLAEGPAGGAAGAEDLQAAFVHQLAQHQVDFAPLPAQLQALMQHANFSHLREKLRLNTTNKADIERAVIKLRLMVSSATISRLGAARSIVLDGDIPGAYGQHGTLVQYGFRGSEVVCVKIGPREKLLREKVAWTSVSTVCTTLTVLPVLDVVELTRSGTDSLPLGVVVMPLCSMSVGFARGAFVGAPQADLAVLVANTATCAGAAAAAFAMANWVHGDIKPSNLLLLPGVPASCRVMLADFGAAAQLGSATLELSASFGLDVPPGTTAYDIACLASSIASLLDPLLRLDTVIAATLRDRAMHHASRDGMLAPLWRLVDDLTQLATDSDLSPEDLTRRLHDLLSGVVSGVRSTLPASSQATLLSVDDVWPRRVQ